MVYKKIIVALCMGFACSSYCLDRFVHFSFDSISKNSEVQALFSVSFDQKLSTVTIEDVWQGAIKDISENEAGRGLVERLCTLLSVFEKIEETEKKGHYASIIKITAKEGGTLFSGGAYKVRRAKFGVQASPMSISLNLDLLHDSIVWHVKHGLCSLIPAVKCHHKDYYATSVCCDPFWMTVAHELIHMEHFLTEELNKYVCTRIFGSLRSKEEVEDALADASKKEKILSQMRQLRGIIPLTNPCGVDIIERLPSSECSDNDLVDYYSFLNDTNRLHARYTKNKDIVNWSDMLESMLKFPELATRKGKRGALDFWYSLEERETVIGQRCSELTLRIASIKTKKPLPIRYLYQTCDTFFLEEKNTLLNLIRLVDSTVSLECLDGLVKDAQEQSFFDLGQVYHLISPERLSDSAYDNFIALREDQRRNLQNLCILKLQKFMFEHSLDEALQMLCESGQVREWVTARLRPYYDISSSDWYNVMIIDRWGYEAKRANKFPSELANDERKNALSEIIDSLLKTL